MKVQLVQIPLVDEETQLNLARVLELIKHCEPDVDLMVFPETTLMGFPSADNVHTISEPENGPTLQAVHKAICDADVSVVIGFAERDGENCFNTTVLMSPEGIVLKYRKTHLWSSDIGIFEPGDSFPTAVWRGLRVGLLICFDIEFPETARALAAQGMDLLLVTNGNMDPYGPVHRALITARAMENQIFAVMVNRAGVGGGLYFAGESAVIDPFGTCLLAMGREEAQATVSLDLNQIARSRTDYHYLKLRRLKIVEVAQQTKESALDTSDDPQSFFYQSSDLSTLGVISK